jgi:hypothetical protein
MLKKQILLFIVMASFDSYINKFEITAPNTNTQLVMAGYITDATGPTTQQSPDWK